MADWRGWRQPTGRRGAGKLAGTARAGRGEGVGQGGTDGGGVLLMGSGGEAAEGGVPSGEGATRRKDDMGLALTGGRRPDRPRHAWVTRRCPNRGGGAGL
jgi:hypothetical protein